MTLYCCIRRHQRGNQTNANALYGRDGAGKIRSLLSLTAVTANGTAGICVHVYHNIHPTFTTRFPVSRESVSFDLLHNRDLCSSLRTQWLWIHMLVCVSYASCVTSRHNTFILHKRKPSQKRRAQGTKLGFFIFWSEKTLQRWWPWLWHIFNYYWMVLKKMAVWPWNNVHDKHHQHIG